MSVVAGRNSEEFSDNDNRNESPNEGATVGYENSNSDVSDQGNADDNNEVEKKVDDDEDRSNPQYIPKRGTFYEHDDRTAASGDESSVDPEGKPPSEGGGGGAGGGGGGGDAGETKGDAKPTRPRRSDAHMWSHDKFIEDQQAPKSREELVAIYGYDIRNEDGPPHARRTRRYGRGPTKYTRTWEDEEAYKRQIAADKKKAAVNAVVPQGAEHFPQLDKQQQQSRTPRNKPKPSRVCDDIKENLENGSLRTIKSHNNNNNSGSTTKTTPPKTSQQAQVDKLNIENLTITTTVNANVKPEPSRQSYVMMYNSDASRRVTTAQQKPSPPQPPQNVEQQKLNAGSNKSTLQQQQFARQQQLLIQQQCEQQERHNAQQQLAQQQTQQQQAQQENRSKRYSSLRQRPLADTYSPQPQQPAQVALQPPQVPMQPAQVPLQPPQVSMQAAQVPLQQPPQGQLQVSQGQLQVSQGQLQVSQGQLQVSQGQLQVSQGPMQAQQGPMQPSLQHRLVQEFQPAPQQQMHSPQQLMHQYDMQVHRSTGTPPHQQQVRLSMMAEQQLVNMHPHSQIQVPQMQPAQIPPQQAYNPQAMMQAQYIQGGTPGAVYAAGVYPAQFQQHTHMYHNYGGGGGGAQYYGGGGGGEAPQRRPTAAIPIVPPPERSGSNSAERENIDRIVDNMFIRKQRNAESAKSDSLESSSSAASETVQCTQVESATVVSEEPSGNPPLTSEPPSA